MSYYEQRKGLTLPYIILEIRAYVSVRSVTFEVFCNYLVSAEEQVWVFSQPDTDHKSATLR